MKIVECKDKDKKSRNTSDESQKGKGHMKF